MGVILYEFLTGFRPFSGPAARVLVDVMTLPPPAFKDVNPEVDYPPEVEALVMRCLAKKPEDRPQTAREVAVAFRTAALLTERPNPPEPKNPKSKLPLRVILAVAGLLVVLGVIIYIATDKGTLKIEGSEPGMVVRIDGQVTTIENVGKPITVRTGPHGLFIKRGDVVAKAPEMFEIKRGRETVVRIEFKPKDGLAGEARKKDMEDTTAEAEAAKEAMPAAKPKSKLNFPASFLGLVGEEWLLKVGNSNMHICWCPGGTFKMGSPTTEPDRNKVDEDQVDVTITKGFWMMKTEMTQELYEALIGKNPSDFKGPKLPVEMVSYGEAVACAAKLTEKLREAGTLPDGWEIRLPTEAQWEYAARAETKTATPFGDNLSSTQANFNGEFPYGGAANGPNLKKTREVGSYKANAWGLYDTAGNVYEWTLDAYEAKMPGGTDPFVAGTGASARVFRGGSWGDIGRYSRSADRRRVSPVLRNRYLGFRLAAVQSVP